MGFFDSLTSIGEGIKRGVGKAVKGIKRGTGKVVKGLKKNVFTKEFGEGFQKGLAKVGRALQEPAKWIKSKDPLRDKMGMWSPISLGTDIALAPVTGIGYLEELAGTPSMRKKLASGDADTIVDTAFSGLSLIPTGGVSKVAKKLGRGAKGGVKKLSRALGGAIKGIF